MALSREGCCRAKGADRRGRALVSQAAAAFEADVSALLSRLPPRERETLSRIIGRLLVAHAADHGIDLFPTA